VTPPVPVAASVPPLAVVVTTALSVAVGSAPLPAIRPPAAACAVADAPRPGPATWSVGVALYSVWSVIPPAPAVTLVPVAVVSTVGVSAALASEAAAPTPADREIPWAVAFEVASSCDVTVTPPVTVMFPSPSDAWTVGSTCVSAMLTVPANKTPAVIANTFAVAESLAVVVTETLPTLWTGAWPIARLPLDPPRPAVAPPPALAIAMPAPTPRPEIDPPIACALRVRFDTAVTSTCCACGIMTPELMVAVSVLVSFRMTTCAPRVASPARPAKAVPLALSLTSSASTAMLPTALTVEFVSM